MIVGSLPFPSRDTFYRMLIEQGPSEERPKGQPKLDAELVVDARFVKTRVCPHNDDDHRPSFTHSMGSLGRLPPEVLDYALRTYLRPPSGNVPFPHVPRCRMCGWIARFTVYGIVRPPPCEPCGRHHLRDGTSCFDDHICRRFRFAREFFLPPPTIISQPNFLLRGTVYFRDVYRAPAGIALSLDMKENRTRLQAQRAVVRGTHQTRQQPRASLRR